MGEMVGRSIITSYAVMPAAPGEPDGERNRFGIVVRAQAALVAAETPRAQRAVAAMIGRIISRPCDRHALRNLAVQDALLHRPQDLAEWKETTGDALVAALRHDTDQRFRGIVPLGQLVLGGIDRKQGWRGESATASERKRVRVPGRPIDDLGRPLNPAVPDGPSLNEVYVLQQFERAQTLLREQERDRELLRRVLLEFCSPTDAVMLMLKFGLEFEWPEAVKLSGLSNVGAAERRGRRKMAALQEKFRKTS